VRLIDSPRTGDTMAAEAADWSMPPERMMEWLLPRLFGDPARGDEDLYFGWGLHDRNYPYVISIYPGLLVLVLAAAAMIRWRVARRSVWIAMLALGLFLALGRFNPLYRELIGGLPPFSLIRYPEKFILLATTALPFAAALGWQRLLDRRREGRAEDCDFPLALAAVLVAATATCAVVLALRPDVGTWWIQGHTPLPLGEESLAAGTAYLRREFLLALAPALIAVAAFAALRWGFRGAGLVAWLAVATLGIELWHYGHRLNQTVPADQVLAPPPLARTLPEDRGRLFSDLAFAQRSEIVARSRRSGPSRMRTSLDRLDPYSGLLWDLGYALNQDFDLMLTDWARFALASLERSWESPAEARRILAAWGVSQRIRVQSIDRLLKRRLKGKRTPPAQLQNVRERMPVHRFTPSVTWHDGRDAAAAALAADGHRLTVGDHWIRAVTADEPVGEETTRASRDTRLLELHEGPGRIAFSYRASAPTYFVSATTFHSGWTAHVDGERLALHPTALGQIGIELPPGEREVTLRFREPTVPWGAAITLLTLVVSLAVVGRRFGAAAARDSTASEAGTAEHAGGVESGAE
jgi:hypothetical protein